MADWVDIGISDLAAWTKDGNWSISAGVATGTLASADHWLYKTFAAKAKIRLTFDWKLDTNSREFRVLAASGVNNPTGAVAFFDPWTDHVIYCQKPADQSLGTYAGNTWYTVVLIVDCASSTAAQDYTIGGTHIGAYAPNASQSTVDRIAIDAYAAGNAGTVQIRNVKVEYWGTPPVLPGTPSITAATGIHGEGIITATPADNLETSFKIYRGGVLVTTENTDNGATWTCVERRPPLGVAAVYTAKASSADGDSAASSSQTITPAQSQTPVNLAAAALLHADLVGHTYQPGFPMYAAEPLIAHCKAYALNLAAYGSSDSRTTDSIADIDTIWTYVQAHVDADHFWNLAGEDITRDGHSRNGLFLYYAYRICLAAGLTSRALAMLALSDLMGTALLALSRPSISVPGALMLGPDWQANHYYPANATIVHNGYLHCSSANHTSDSVSVSGSWSTTYGGTTTDNGTNWTCYGKVHTLRANSTVTAVGQTVLVGGHQYLATAIVGDAKTASSPPTFNTTAGSTTTDGNVTWTEDSATVGIFTATYTRSTKAAIGTGSVDVNQVMECAAFPAMLASDVNSSHYADSTCLSVADDHLTAALRMQRADGAVLLTDIPTTYDYYDSTGYGRFALQTASMIHAETYLGLAYATRLGTFVARGKIWLDTYGTEPNVHHCLQWNFSGGDLAYAHLVYVVESATDPLDALRSSRAIIGPTGNYVEYSQDGSGATDDYSSPVQILAPLGIQDAVLTVAAVVLTPADMASAPALQAATVAQVFALAPDDIVSQTAVQAAALTEAVALAPEDIASAPTIAVPAIAQDVALAPSAVSSAPDITAAGLIEVATFSPASMTSAPQMEAAAIVGAGEVSPTDMTCAPTMEISALLAESVVLAAELVCAAVMEDATLDEECQLTPANVACPATVQGAVVTPDVDTPPATYDAHRSALMSDTVTVYNSLGEVDRKAAFTRAVLSGVRFEVKSAVVATMGGGSSADGALLFVPGSMPGHVEPEAFTGQGWTLREGDLLVDGECDMDIPPGSVAQIEAVVRVFRITGVEPFSLRGHVHHWEVAGA